MGHWRRESASSIPSGKHRGGGGVCAELCSTGRSYTGGSTRKGVSGRGEHLNRGTESEDTAVRPSRKEQVVWVGGLGSRWQVVEFGKDCLRPWMGGLHCPAQGLDVITGSGEQRRAPVPGSKVSCPLRTRALAAVVRGAGRGERSVRRLLPWSSKS